MSIRKEFVEFGEGLFKLVKGARDFFVDASMSSLGTQDSMPKANKNSQRYENAGLGVIKAMKEESTTTDSNS